MEEVEDRILLFSTDIRGLYLAYCLEYSLCCFPPGMSFAL